MSRIIPLENEHFYHIYNRGTDKRKIFMDDKDYIRFIVSMREFNSVEPVGSLYELRQLKKYNSNSGPTAPSDRTVKTDNIKLLNNVIGQDKVLGGRTAHRPLVKIICYSLLPNHFHMILEQLADGGISEFMKRLGGYTWYFNKKHQRSGSLFQGKFKSAHIKESSRLYWLSSYVNCNAEIHKIKKAEKWPWSSYLDFIGKRNGDMADKKEIFKYFTSTEEYINFSKEVTGMALEDRMDNKDLLE